MRPVMGHLKAQGLMSVDYLDILLTGKNYEECYTNVETTRTLLELLGFILNEKKSRLFPSKQYSFLGFEIDLHECIISLPKKKKLKILNLIRKMINRSESKIRDLTQLI